MAITDKLARCRRSRLFLQADIVVKSVMVGLLLASIWTWTIIVAQWLRMRRARRENERFERDFWKSEDIDSFYESRGNERLAVRQGARRRRRRMAPLDRRPERSTARARAPGSPSPWPRRWPRRPTSSPTRLNILATVGSVAPFVGLFGTVWGIMRSFTDIAGAQNTSLAVVAPGIAEALFATAIGLFAAIPAVIAYNRFSYGINRHRGAPAALRRRLPRARSAASWRRRPRWRWARSSAAGGAARRDADGGDQRHADGRRDAGAADHLHGHRAAARPPASRSICPTARRRRSSRTAEPVTISIDGRGAGLHRRRAGRRSTRSARGCSRSPRRAASRAGRASSCAPTAASITAG